ncbi:NAD(P)H-quinone oxidoreductase subunit 4 [Chlorogloea sp. CCALA 695]|uniref:NAD(P)H-quinone oxidoreductase subunit 4 n=1 Tax=Chlorogloea sp. CCALA 695 TaxID=2107693 RepID=UPI000D06F42F|nr:NAD(P)H-quinone oxidoreductase subunit 4 [Chlorogloea sp. CCALA 695]PSB33453.1 NAD(P)H-quinone oxidoreductase subunit 4 [Chlorogloea sp. CCALA 695]
MAEQFPWLTTIILLPAIAALLIPVLPDKDGKRVKWYAVGVAIADLILICYAFWQNYDPSNATFQLAESYAWIPQLKLNWAVSVDGLSAPLVLLAGFVTTLAIFSAWQVDRRPKLFYMLMLLLYSAQIGVFVAQDLLLFFIMWEVELVPVYLLISIWGGKKRRYAATKFIIYTAAASIFILVAALGMAFSGGSDVTFDIAQLALKDYPLALELVLYAGLIIAFGVKLAIFPMHTWLPDAHGEASTPVSMVLAGVLLKMGGYGLIRLNLELLPAAHIYFAPLLAILGVVNIIYGALNSFAQTNMKRRLAYSSVSHMGFVLLGIASFTDIGINGAMLQMISHGLIASVLFFLAGVTYDRTQTMVMSEMSGIGQVMPKVFALFTISAMASLALPGMSGFASEILIFVGVTTSDIYSSTFCTVTVLLAAVGVILTPIYLLSMLRQVFYGTGAELNCNLDDDQEQNQEDEESCFGTDCVLPSQAIYRDASWRELSIAASFIVLIVGIGLYPRFTTQMYDAKTVAVNTQVRQSYTQIARTNPGIYANRTLAFKRIAQVETAEVLGIVK